MQWNGIHALILQAKAKDPEAWRALEAMSRGFMLGIAQQFLGSGWPHGSVSDLTQEAWVRVCSTLDEFRGGENDAQTGAAFRALLKKAMKSQYANGLRHYRTARRRPPPGTVRAGANDPDGSSVGVCDPPAPDQTPSTPLREAEEREQVRKALAGLDPEDGAAVELHFFRGRSLAQIADELALTFDQARYRLHRALARLGRELGGDNDRPDGNKSGSG